MVPTGAFGWLNEDDELSYGMPNWLKRYMACCDSVNYFHYAGPLDCIAAPGKHVNEQLLDDELAEGVGTGVSDQSTRTFPR